MTHSFIVKRIIAHKSQFVNPYCVHKSVTGHKSLVVYVGVMKITKSSDGFYFADFSMPHLVETRFSDGEGFQTWLDDHSKFLKYDPVLMRRFWVAAKREWEREQS